MPDPINAAVPVIDLDGDRAEVVAAVADAATTFGFFQITGHGIDDELIGAVWSRTRAFFALPMAGKRRVLRTKENTRGYYDRELTKNARDQKEVFDIANVPRPDLPADHPSNHHAVDGNNQWPAELPELRATMLAWMTACEQVSFRLLSAFAEGLGEPPDALDRFFGPDHTSFVRLNHYPVDDPLDDDEASEVTALGDQALHHHSDAGALTVLLQDDVGGLQVFHDGGWIDVDPIPDALVVNTGDMMQVWSNDRYRAALHRVAPVTDRPRYSLPYFFNPSSATDYAPLPRSIVPGGEPHYEPINWGRFRQARADGDFADYGTEIQIADFRR